MPKVLIPTPLRKLTNDADTVSAEGGSIRAVIDDLEKNYPGVKERVLTPDGKQHRFILIFVGEEDIRFLNNLDTEVKEADTVSIVPAIAGG